MTPQSAIGDNIDATIYDKVVAILEKEALRKSISAEINGVYLDLKKLGLQRRDVSPIKQLLALEDEERDARLMKWSLLCRALKIEIKQYSLFAEPQPPQPETRHTRPRRFGANGDEIAAAFDN